MAYQSVNPFNGEVIRTFDQHTDQQMEQMLATADRTFREVWSRKPVRETSKGDRQGGIPDARAKGEVRPPRDSRNGKADRREPRRS